MNELFLKIVNMSISASWLVLAVVILRFALKRSPKWINVLLWGIVAVRLICPFSFESVFSLIPSAETIPLDIEMNTTPTIDSGISSINGVINPIISGSNTPAPGASINPLQITVGILENLWILGFAALIIYAAISYIGLCRKVRTAVLYKNNIYQSENVVSPFVLGLIKPRIYLPYDIDERDMQHVIAHEEAHISRKDHLWKPLGFLLLALHWFNPVMWIAYILLCRDIELACDESIIKDLGNEERANYSEALVACSVNRRIIAACPLAFGEVGVKERVKSVLNYKKPAFWIILVAVIASIVLAVCFLTNPKTRIDDPKANDFIEAQILQHHTGKYEVGEFRCADFKVLATEKSGNNTTVYMWVLYQEYNETDGEIENISGAHIPTVITFSEDGGDYTLVEYWEPRDGSLYRKDLAEKFPWYLQIFSLDSQRYIKEQTQNCLEMAKKHFEANVNNQTVRSFKLFEVVYTDTAYPYALPVDSMVYTIINNRQFVQYFEGTSYNVGTFRQIEINNDTYDSRFRREFSSWVSDDVLEKIKQNNKNAWQLYCGEADAGPSFYILLEQLDGAFYLGYGYYNSDYSNNNSDSSHIRWLYKLGEIQGIVGSNGDTSKFPTAIETLTQCPGLSVVSGKTSIDALKTTVSWTSRQEDGRFATVVGDPVHALLLKEYMPKLDLMPSYISSINPLDAVLIFTTDETSHSAEVPPNSITVRCWRTDEWGNIGAESENIEVQFSGEYWYFRMNYGEYVYEITAEWTDYENFSGTARYAFYTSPSLYLENDLPITEELIVDSIYSEMPEDEAKEKLENEEFVITRTHCKTTDGKWYCLGFTYDYRIEVSGRMPNAAKNTSYIVLCNRTDITFEKAYLASGVSSSTADYFDPGVAVIVGHKLYE